MDRAAIATIKSASTLPSGNLDPKYHMSITKQERKSRSAAPAVTMKIAGGRLQHGALPAAIRNSCGTTSGSLIWYSPAEYQTKRDGVLAVCDGKQYFIGIGGNAAAKVGGPFMAKDKVIKSMFLFTISTICFILIVSDTKLSPLSFSPLPHTIPGRPKDTRRTTPENTLANTIQIELTKLGFARTLRPFAPQVINSTRQINSTWAALICAHTLCQNKEFTQLSNIPDNDTDCDRLLCALLLEVLRTESLATAFTTWTTAKENEGLPHLDIITQHLTSQHQQQPVPLPRWRISNTAKFTTNPLFPQHNISPPIQNALRTVEAPEPATNRHQATEHPFNDPQQEQSNNDDTSTTTGHQVTKRKSYMSTVRAHPTLSSKGFPKSRAIGKNKPRAKFWKRMQKPQDNHPLQPGCRIQIVTTTHGVYKRNDQLRVIKLNHTRDTSTATIEGFLETADTSNSLENISWIHTTKLCKVMIARHPQLD